MNNGTQSGGFFIPLTNIQCIVEIWMFLEKTIYLFPEKALGYPSPIATPTAQKYAWTEPMGYCDKFIFPKILTETLYAWGPKG